MIHPVVCSKLHLCDSSQWMMTAEQTRLCAWPSSTGGLCLEGRASAGSEKCDCWSWAVLKWPLTAFPYLCMGSPPSTGPREGFSVRAQATAPSLLHPVAFPVGKERFGQHAAALSARKPVASPRLVQISNESPAAGSLIPDQAPLHHPAAQV